MPGQEAEPEAFGSASGSLDQPHTPSDIAEQPVHPPARKTKSHEGGGEGSSAGTGEERRDPPLRRLKNQIKTRAELQTLA